MWQEEALKTVDRLYEPVMEWASRWESDLLTSDGDDDVDGNREQATANSFDGNSNEEIAKIARMLYITLNFDTAYPIILVDRQRDNRIRDETRKLGR